MASVTGGGVGFWIDLTLIEFIQWMNDAIEAQREDKQRQEGVN